MSRQRRWPLRLLLFVAVIVAAAVIAAPFVPLDSFKPTVESRLSATLGRAVSVSAMRLSLAGGPYLVIQGMSAKEDPAFGEGNFLEAGEVRANLALLPFALRRQIVIESLELKAPQFTFVKNPQGAWSWTTLGRNRATAHSFEPFESFSRKALASIIAAEATVDGITLENGSIRLIDRSGIEPPESLYRNVYLRADITRRQADSQVVGQLRADSQEDAQLLKTDLPFDLLIDRSAPQGLAVRGSLGPGRLETSNFVADSFKTMLDFKENRLALDQMDLSLYEGSLTGRMEMDLASQQFTIEGEVAHLNLDQALGSKLQVPGQITGHIDAQFKLDGVLRNFQETIPTVNGTGRLSSNEMFIASVNVSEQVARALRLNEIGDMSAGTKLGSLQSDFQISRGEMRTTNLSIQQLDGLGDATSNQGWLRVASAPVLDYSATVLLTPDATARVKSTSPLLGMAISMLEYNNRVAVPVSIRGEVRNPVVQVDVSRLLQ